MEDAEEVVQDGFRARRVWLLIRASPDAAAKDEAVRAARSDVVVYVGLLRVRVGVVAEGGDPGGGGR